MNTTTQHLKALLVDDGREFAMVRKADLKGLMITIGKGVLIERKHGEERRRYMANNKALLVRNDELSALNDQLEYSLELKERQKEAAWFTHISLSRKVIAAIRKAPATCRMLGLVR